MWWRLSSGNIVFTTICNAEQQESQDEEINLGGSQENEVEPAFPGDATSEIHDSSIGTAIVRTRANPPGPKFEKRGCKKAPPKGSSKYDRVSCPILSYGRSNFEFGARMRTIAVVVYVL